MTHKLLTATLFAATMAPRGQADEPAPEKQVAALSEQHRLAAIKGDTKVLDAVLADDWVVVGPTGEVETKREQEKKIKDRSLVFEAIDPKEVTVRVHGDAAIVMGLYTSRRPATEGRSMASSATRGSSPGRRGRGGASSIKSHRWRVRRPRSADDGWQG
jgi:hypothetical protein